MSKMRFWAAAFGILIVVSGILAFTAQRGNPLSEKEAAAIERCNSSNLFNRAVVLEFSQDIFPNYEFFVVSSTSILGVRPPTSYCIVGVGDSGSSYLLPEEWNSMVKSEEPLNLSEMSILVRFANTLTRVVVFPERPRIIETADEIPVGAGTNPQLFSDVIKPVQIDKTSEGYVLQFYTWSSLGGVLAEWNLEVRADGWSVFEHADIARRVGKFSGRG